MDAALEGLIWQRSEGCCEYCRLPQSSSPLPHEIDHIIAIKHGGSTAAKNLALSCVFWKSQT